MFANAIRNDEYFRNMQMKAVESRSERVPQQRTPLEDIQNNDELLPLEMNDDMDDVLNDNNNDFLDDNEDIGDSYWFRRSRQWFLEITWLSQNRTLTLI